MNFRPKEIDTYSTTKLPLPLGASNQHFAPILQRASNIIQLAVLDPQMSENGWFFSTRMGLTKEDPLYGFKYLKDLYLKANPGYQGRYTVPVLWDRKKETIVNNESSEIIRMFYTEFDAYLPEGMQESAHPVGGLYPLHLRR